MVLKLVTLVLFLSLFVCTEIRANQGQNLSKEKFLNLAFPSPQSSTSQYKLETLWLTKGIKQEAENILGHPFNMLRIRYWTLGNRTAWIMDEIGKVKPITTGVIIENQAIQSVHILAFRESRGWEVKYPFFTEQFIRATLDNNNKLDKQIDGITGATLSVRAVKKIARLALFFHTITRDGSL
ncbi:MAG: FMN-binding protein [Pseudomonadales bacterium]|nr:FMN-binding protein [Pseudomonadales bacterium]